MHFSGALALFAGLSLYALFSFFQATNTYVTETQTNVFAATNASEVAEPVMTVDEVPVALSDNPFLDLGEDHPNRDAIVALYYQGIVNGGADGNFRPDDSVNRAEFAKMVVEATDIDLADVDPIEGCFVDVTSLSDQWFAPYVCAAKVENYVSGYEGGVFMAHKNINRAESLKIVLNAFGFAVNDNVSLADAGFDDLLSSDWFVGVAEAAKRNGLIALGGSFEGSHEMTRGEVAQVIYNAMEAQNLL
ncbi:MAG: hypothetical protein CO040_04685 [Candidatus Pacebacteria bacterium CG_4_9_14_0_2_um_filter_36_8]|nr:MAG: hypothetical protein CO040_04685 [Candidatus Pacebacteria bacterium CG_4_9_14_0_2_um_filter_36_8]